MGQSTPEEIERNEALYNDWKIMRSYSKVAIKYGITATRVGQIIRRARLLDVLPGQVQDFD